VAWDRTTLQAFPSSEVTHLHLLRHGKPEVGKARRCYGHTDLPLSDVGLAQSAALQAWSVRHIPKPDRVLTSDLQRARVTAEALADQFGVPLVVDPHLREQHMGAWEGQTWAALTEADIVGTRHFWTHYDTARPPGGESLADLSERVGQAMDRHWDTLRGGRTVVVGHAGVIRVLLCRALGMPVSEALRFAPVPGSHTWLQLAQAGAVVQTLGERPLASDPGIVAAARAAAVLKRDRPPRIALAGSAGTGKSTLGRALAAHYGVPYIPEGMRERLEGGLDVHGLGHRGFRRLVDTLWREWCARVDAALSTHGGFVADRSPWDFATFWLVYRFVEQPDAVAQVFQEARARTQQLDRLVVLPWGGIPLVDDGVRSANPWTQRLFQSSLEGLVSREVPDDILALMPALQTVDGRVAWVTDLMAETGTALDKRGV